MKRIYPLMALLSAVAFGCFGVDDVIDAHGVGGPAEIWSRVADGYYRGPDLFELTVYDSHDYSVVYGRAVFENSDGYFKFHDLPADTVDLVVRTKHHFTAKLGEITLLPGINALRDFGAHVPRNRPFEELILLASITGSIYHESQLYIRRKSFMPRIEVLVMAFAAGCDTLTVPDDAELDDDWELLSKPDDITLKNIIDRFAYRRETREIYPNVQRY